MLYYTPSSPQRAERNTMKDIKEETVDQLFERLAAMGIKDGDDLIRYFRPPMWLKVLSVALAVGIGAVFSLACGYPVIIGVGLGAVVGIVSAAVFSKL